MWRILPITLLAVVGTLMAVGCAGRHRRPFHSEPFAAPRPPRQRGGAVTNEHTRPVEAVEESEVTQAGHETPASNPKAERPQWTREADSMEDTQRDHPEVKTGSNRDSSKKRPKSAPIMDHDPAYSWVQGKLEFSAIGGGVWKVRYAPLSADDPYGGSVILDPPPDSNRFHPGDTVYVEGQVVANESRGAYANPAFRVQRMLLVEE